MYDYDCWEEGVDYFGELDNTGCCLNCDYAELGCLCDRCKCSRCSQYTGDSCSLADLWKADAEEKRLNWESFVDNMMYERKMMVKLRLKGKNPNQLIEQKILDMLKFESNSSMIIDVLQKIGFNIDDIFLAFDSLQNKKNIKEKINFATHNYKGQIGHYEVIKNAK